MSLNALLVLVGIALSAPEPGEILAEVDRAANRAQDATLTLEISVSTRGSRPLERTMKVWQLGLDRRMVKFVSPARLRGTGILVPRSGQTYLYSRAYDRVRRVAGREGGGSFMGTGFSINDLARVRFSPDYDPSLEAQDETHWVLRLAPKEPDRHAHASLRLRIRKADHLVALVVTLDSEGKALRTITASGFKAVGAYTIAHQIQIDEEATGKSTLAVVSEAAFDTGLREDFFTERQLRRAP